jgi:hypothetical protein
MEGDDSRRSDMTAIETDTLREQILSLIDGVDARMSFDEAVADFPPEAINAFPPNLAYTPWHLLEHLRITQWDILDYIVNRDYQELRWPQDYWPSPAATATPAEFQATIAGFIADNQQLHDIVADPTVDLLAEIPNTPGHTILREIRVASDHNSYHIGEFAILRQVMGTWLAGHR